MTEKYVVRVHTAEEGGYWADVPALPGCMSQGETLDELVENVLDAIGSYVTVREAEAGTMVAERRPSKTRQTPASMISVLEFATA